MDSFLNDCVIRFAQISTMLTGELAMEQHSLNTAEVIAARFGYESLALRSARRRMPLSDAFRLVADARR
jgi:hypothetical protein